MREDIGMPRMKVTRDEVKKFIEGLRVNHRIYLENSEHDLLQASGLDEGLPMVNYLINDNQRLNDLKEYQRRNPDGPPIAIEFLRWSNAFDRLTTAEDSLSFERQPDVVQVGSTWVAHFAHKGVLENLKGLYDEKEFFEPSVAAAHPIGLDGFYAVPWFVDVRVLYYWKDLVSLKTISSWQNISENCASFVDKHPDKKSMVGFPFGITWNILHYTAPLLWAYGGDVLGPRNLGSIPAHEVLLDSPKSLEAIGKMKELSSEGCIGFENVNMEGLENNFLKGNYAAIITGTWFLEQVQKEKDWQNKIGISSPPAGTKGSFPFVGGSHFGIWHTSKERGNFEHAQRLIAFFSSPEIQKNLDNITLLPASRVALDEVLAGRAYMQPIKEALENGRSYPPIAEWGNIVENEFILQHMWHIWHGISQARPVEILEGTVKNAASSLRKRVVLAFWDKGKWHIAGLVLAAIFAAGIIIKRRQSSLVAELMNYRMKLEKVECERVILASELLIVSQDQKEREERLEDLRSKIGSLTKESDELRERLNSIHKKQGEIAGSLLERVRISWEGRVYVGDEEISFENANQAMRLIEHMVREAALGLTSVSCLWGYPLFGWDTSKLRSMPNRLFNTAVAKINAAFSAKKLPQFLKSEGRSSFRWQCLWSPEVLLKSSDVARAAAKIAEAKRATEQGNEGLAAELSMQALNLDPKCVDALLCVARTPGHARDDALVSDIDSLKFGVSAIGELLRLNTLPDEHVELMQAEMSVMKQRAEHLLNIVQSFSAGGKKDERSFYISQIIDRLFSVSSDIAGMRADGETNKDIWATVVESDDFKNILSVPKIQTLVNRFYNYEMKSYEDPRLVQLALVHMLSNEERLSMFKKAKNESDFFCDFEKELKKQFRFIEQELSTLPSH